MIEAVGNIWSFPADYRVITTNGCVKKDGSAVMGRGVAKQAANRFKSLPFELGKLLKSSGNKCYIFKHFDNLITFPVKYNWFDKADLDLIKKSTAELSDLANMELKYKTIIMPRAGCGNGNRTWEEVKPILMLLPDNVYIITLSVGMD